MARTFTTNFSNQLTSTNSKPYFVLQVDWYVNDAAYPDYVKTRYYLDRPSNSFDATGVRIPSLNVSECKVIDWGQVKLTLRENQVGAVDDFSIKIEDHTNEIRDYLDTYVQQRELITIYRMFDADTVVWPTDRAKIFVGCIKPYSWTEQDGVITIPLEDISKRILATIELRPDRNAFLGLPQSGENKNIPLVWGSADRVPAVLVDCPWETRTLDAIPKTATPPFSVKIADHADELNTNPSYFPQGTSMQAIKCWLGFDEVSGYISDSGNKDTTPSTFVVTGINLTTKASAAVIGAYGFTTSRTGVIDGGSIFPTSLRTSLEDVVTVGTSVEINIGGVWRSDVISAFTKDAPAQGYYQFKLTTYNSSIAPGQPIRFLTGTQQRQWPAGTVLRIKESYGGNPALWTYACNALPSKAIRKVEGYGSIVDSSGQAREDFVILGGKVADQLVGTIQTSDVAYNPYTVDLNDSTWVASLGRNITTITFYESPRSVDPTLKDNRIWVSLDGVESSGDSSGTTITNPAAIIAEYLENPELMNLDADFINETSFTDAATNLPNRHMAFAQLESVDGLTFLQEVARQAKSVLFFDQGEIQMKVLGGFSGSPIAHFSNTTIQEGSISYEDLDISEMVTRVISKYRRAWDDISGNKLLTRIYVNSTREASYGKNSVEFPLWCYRRFVHVDDFNSWVAGRFGDSYRIIKFKAFHEAMKLQPGDWARITYAENLYAQFTDLVASSVSLAGGSFSDLATHASSGLLVSSASRPFVATDIGRVLTVTGGTGWTTGGYTIVTVDENGYARVSPTVYGVTEPAAAGVSGGLFSLATVGSSGVSTSAWSFTLNDIGKSIYINGGGGWSGGSYRIRGVSSGSAILASAPASPGTTGGSGYFCGRVPLDSADCVVLDVKDNGPTGIFDVTLRFARAMPTRLIPQKQ